MSEVEYFTFLYADETAESVPGECVKQVYSITGGRYWEVNREMLNEEYTVTTEDVVEVSRRYVDDSLDIEFGVRFPHLHDG